MSEVFEWQEVRVLRLPLAVPVLLPRGADNLLRGWRSVADFINWEEIPLNSGIVAREISRALGGIHVEQGEKVKDEGNVPSPALTCFEAMCALRWRE